VEAYGILSDEDKKGSYDRGEDIELLQSFYKNNDNISDLLSQLFGNVKFRFV